MLKGIWGKKIGMTQLFSDTTTQVIPVTVIDLDHWYITQIFDKEKRGYAAIQVGYLRRRYQGQPFSLDWLKDLKKYFSVLREIRLDEKNEESVGQVGQLLDVDSVLQNGQMINVFGITKGRGFQGVVKRHGFRGGTASHGPRFGRWPGSMGFMRSQGKIIKGKRLPGHMGCDTRITRNLEVVRVQSKDKIALIKGSVPGGLGGLVFMQKA